MNFQTQSKKLYVNLCRNVPLSSCPLALMKQLGQWNVHYLHSSTACHAACSLSLKDRQLMSVNRPSASMAFVISNQHHDRL